VTPILAAVALDAGAANSGTMAFIVGACIVVLYALRKLRTVITFLAILFGFFMASFIIMAVPWFHVEPIYSILLDFYTALPNYVGDTAQFFRNLLGAI